MAEPSTDGTTRQRRFGRRWVRAGAVVVLAIAAGIGAWLLVRDDEGSTATPTATTPQATGVGPVAMSRGELASLSRTLDQPIYWAGARRGFTYEVTRTADRKVYVRYLPKGVKVGDSRADYLIVATYPYPRALRALRGVAGKRAVRVRGGASAFVDPTYPKSVHMAFPDADYQIEVFDPSPARARRVALSGDVTDVG
jgi:hypothetical protein